MSTLSVAERCGVTHFMRIIPIRTYVDILDLLRALEGRTLTVANTRCRGKQIREVSDKQDGPRCHN
jgi:hypothetical protein